MILSTVRMTILPRRHGEALKNLRTLAGICRNDFGCISCHIYEDLQEQNVFMLEGVWRTDEDLYQCIRSEKYRNLILKLASKPPEIRFDTIAAFDGHRDH